MGRDSKIEWTNHTFNPWWGCAKLSPACNHCYAEQWAKRVGQDLWGKDAPRRLFGDNHWNQPLLWNRQAASLGARRRVFCASMADVFEARGELDVWRGKLWDLVKLTPNLDWLLLTKRPENVNKLTPWGKKWPDNVWLGTTVENHEQAIERVPFIVRTAARICFLSCEPLLGPVDLSPWLSHIQWVIVGGESGSFARLMQPKWVQGIRDSCAIAHVPFFFKQWGTYNEEGEKVGKKQSGRLFDGELWSQLPDNSKSL